MWRGRCSGARRYCTRNLSWRGSKRVDQTNGRDGIAAKQVLSVAILKQMTACSYDDLAFRLLDSSTYRTFIPLGFDDDPLTKSTLQRNVKRAEIADTETNTESFVMMASFHGQPSAPCPARPSSLAMQTASFGDSFREIR